MLGPEESAELRSLQERAYRRGGGVSGDDLERLRALEERRRGRVPEVPTRPGPTHAGDTRSVDEHPVDGEHPVGEHPVGEHPVDGEHPVGEHPVDGEEAFDEDVSGPAPDRPSRSRPWWRGAAVAAVAAAALGAGIGIGGALSGGGGDAVALSPEQQERRAELYAENAFDPGSLVAAAEDDGVLAWTATAREGKNLCLVVDDGTQAAVTCQAAQFTRESGMSASLRFGGDADDVRENVHAYMMLSSEDRPMVHLQRWSVASTDYIDQFTDEAERATARRLLDEGFDDWSPAVAGYDGDVPVWTATRENGSEVCLFYGSEAPDPPSVCDSMSRAQGEGLTIGFVAVDSSTGATSSRREVTFRYTPQQNGYLVITDSAAEASVVRDESGDVVELQIDDKTGRVSP